VRGHLFLLLLLACRTPPDEKHDLSPGTDFSAGDLASNGPCGGCGPSEICVFVDRGDCSKFICATLPQGFCSDQVSCDCLPTSVCADLTFPDRAPGETLICDDSFTQPGTSITCKSSIQCV
jgi:hypothetical protein